MYREPSDIYLVSIFLSSLLLLYVILFVKCPVLYAYIDRFFFSFECFSLISSLSLMDFQYSIFLFLLGNTL